MERERGIIIVGHGGFGSTEMINKALVHCSDMHFQGYTEHIKKLKTSFETIVMSSKEENEKLKQALQTAALVFKHSTNHIDQAKEIFEKMEQMVIQEKPQSKFISKPRHNFRKR